MVRKLVNFFGSLRLTISVLVVLAAILIGATWLSGYDISVGALRRDLYGSWWFNVLLGLLMINLVVCTVKRKPWKFWQRGFLITHTGVLTLMVGAGVSFNWKIYGDMQISEGGRAASFVEEGEREIVVRTAEGEQRYRLDVNPYKRSRPGRVFPVRGTPLALVVDEYVPNVAEDLVYAPAPGGAFDVLEMKMQLGAQPAETIFIPRGQSAGNGLITFTYPDGDALQDGLSGDAGAEGTLVLTIDGETRELDVHESTGKSVRVGKRDVTITQFFRSFTLGEDGQPAEQPDAQDANPAVLLEVSADGKSATYYVFAYQPESSPMRRGGGMHGHGGPDFAARMRYSPRESRVWIFPSGDGAHYVITTKSGRKVSGTLRPGERVKHPTMPADFYIGFERRIAPAELTVREEPPRKGRPPLPAVRLRLVGQTGEPSGWLRLGERTQAGEALTIGFVPKVYSDLGFTVELVKFSNPPHEGTSRASKFESLLRIRDPRTGEVVEGRTGVNYPFRYKGWSFYQSAFNDKVQPVVSILQVAYDPGKPVLYLGCIMTAAGTIFMFFLKPSFLKLVQSAHRTFEVPMATPAVLGFLLLLCGGTIAGMALLLLRVGIDPLALGAAMAGLSMAAAFAMAGVAARLRERRPRFALQLSQLVSAAWILNTAALVIFMIVRVS